MRGLRSSYLLVRGLSPRLPSRSQPRFQVSGPRSPGSGSRAVGPTPRPAAPRARNARVAPKLDDEAAFGHSRLALQAFLGEQRGGDLDLEGRPHLGLHACTFLRGESGLLATMAPSRLSVIKNEAGPRLYGCVAPGHSVSDEVRAGHGSGPQSGQGTPAAIAGKPWETA